MKEKEKWAEEARNKFGQLSLDDGRAMREKFSYKVGWLDGFEFAKNKLAGDEDWRFEMCSVDQLGEGEVEND